MNTNQTNQTNQSNQGFVAQAKEFVSDKFVSAKHAVADPKATLHNTKEYVTEKIEDIKQGMGKSDHPQSKVEHDQPFLDDIAKGNAPSLNHVTPVEKDLNTVLGDNASNIHVKKVDREPLLHEIKDGVPLSHIETEDRSKPVIQEGVTIKNVGEQRQQMLNEVESFPRENLTPQLTDDRSCPNIPEDVQLKDMEASSHPSVITQAKVYVKETFRDAKEHAKDPKGTLAHTKEYVSDKLESAKLAMADPKGTLHNTKGYVSDKVESAKSAMGMRSEQPYTEIRTPDSEQNIEIKRNDNPIEAEKSAVTGCK